jgi:hypothetical protein
MGVIDDIADELAQGTMGIIDTTGDDAVVKEIADTLGGSSQTLEEAYLTAVRVRRAEKRARDLLALRRSAVGLDPKN